MKKSSRWGGIIAGVIGILLVAMNLNGLATTFAHPTSLPQIDHALMINDLLGLCVAIFLIAIFIRSRQHADNNLETQRTEPNNLSETESLDRRRNWTLGFVILFFFISSSTTWFLNDYMAGPTLTNIYVIFDIVSNIALLYAAIQLFRKKKTAPTPLFYIVLTYSLVETVLSGLRHEWSGVIVNLATAAYFVFALKAPTTKANFRIAHFIGLPVLIIAFMATNALDASKINKITQDETQLEQQYSTLTGNISSDYQLFLQKQHPDDADIQALQNQIQARQDINNKMLDDISKLRTEYSKQLPNIDQIRQLDSLTKYTNLLAIQQKQANTLSSLLTYSKQIGSGTITNEQRAQMAKLEQEIQNEEVEITKAYTKFNTP